jgi:hypothetical protein
MVQRTKELPAGWGDDKLSDHVGIVHGNTLFIFEAKKDDWKKLQEIDEIFRRLLDGPPRQVISFLFFLCHSAYRAAVILGIGGHATEAYVVLRVALEDALYAAFLADNDERFKRWILLQGSVLYDGTFGENATEIPTRPWLEDRRCLESTIVPD